MQCYSNSDGYLVDVVYRNTVPPVDIAICNTPQEQLDESTLTQLEISASDSLIRMHVCGDSHGIRGLAFDTALGEHVECGATSKKGCTTTFSSRGVYPLGGFSGSCAVLSGHQAMGVRVTGVFNTCWNTQPLPRRVGECRCTHIRSVVLPVHMQLHRHNASFGWVSSAEHEHPRKMSVAAVHAAAPWQCRIVAQVFAACKVYAAPW